MSKLITAIIETKAIRYSILLLLCGILPIIYNHAQSAVSIYLLTHVLLIGLIVPAQSLEPRTLLLLGIVLRIIASCVPSFTSNDVARYLWDGAVVNHGFNPYVMSPASLKDLINFPFPPDHQSIPTVYPPAALMLFQLCAIDFTTGYWIWKGICCLCSIVSLLLLYSFMQHHGSHREALVVLSPLLILEACIGAHLDGISCFFVCLSYYCYRIRTLAFLSGAALMLALGVKTSYFIVVPIFIYDWYRQGRLQSALLGVLSIALCLIAYCIYYSFFPLGSLGTMLKHWSFGSPLFTILESMGLEYLQRLLLPIVIFLGPWYAAKRYPENPIQAMMLSFLLVFAVSPVCYPWYLLLPCMLLCIQFSAVLWLWSSVLPFTYEVIIQYKESGIWEPAYYPLVCILLSWILGYRLEQQQKEIENK